MNSLDSIQFLDFKEHIRGVTKLLAIEGDQLGCASLKRVFFLTSTGTDNRGAHAHKNCSQWFTILSGKSILKVSDGHTTRSLELLHPSQVIQIPPGIWVDVLLLEPTIIAVFADLKYDEDDYIRVWDDFLTFRGTK